jgi:predicted enzyme related to lactoylglutathione lyase
MSNITTVVLKVAVPDLESALPFYQALTGADQVDRFGYAAVKLAHVGNFLLIEGAPNGRPAQSAGIFVRSLGDLLSSVESAGGELLEGPDDTPNGRRVIIRHPDGIEFEYLETTDAPTA